MARRYVMIGTGPASISAAQAVRSQDPGGSIVFIGDEPHGYYSRPGLAYYLADEVPERQLFPFRHEDFAHLGVQLFLKRAMAIDPAGHRVTLENGQVIPYDRLLIATGARATPLKIPGADLDGVVTLDNMDDAHQLIRRGRRGKTAVVVGGGITALEIAEGLHARRVHVHYLMRKDRYWGDVLSASESRIVEQAVRVSGVEIHHFAELAQVIGQRGRVAAVETVAGERIPCDLLGVAIGVLPRTALAVAAGLRCARGILVDQHLRSSDKDIYAAGDVAEVYEPLTDRNTLEVLWSSAVAKGRIAGLNMAGQPTHVYEKGVPLNVTRLAGLKTTIMGLVGSGTDPDLQSLARGDSETWRQLHRAVSVEWQAGGDHIRLTLGDTNILGAVVMGDQAASFALRQLIADCVDVSGIRERFFEPTTAMSDLIQGFWTEWRAHHG